MTQNRNKLVELFISNLTNAIVHQVLEKAIDNSEIANRYLKEFRTSWDIAKKYREKINPANKALPDVNEIKDAISKKARAKLQVRIDNGYENIELRLVEEFLNKALKELRVV